MSRVHIPVLDAADPGDVSLVEMEQLQELGLSTHAANLALLFQAN